MSDKRKDAMRTEGEGVPSRTAAAPRLGTKRDRSETPPKKPTRQKKRVPGSRQR